MRAGFTVSVVAHIALVAWGVVSFTGRPLKALQSEALPVDVISAKEFSEITKGSKTAKLKEPAKPLVEKVAETPKVVDDPDTKVEEKKPEIKAAQEAAPPPPAPEKKPEPPKEAKAEPPKPEVKPEPKPEPPKQAKAEPKPDPIAEALKKEAAKPPPKLPPKKPETKTAEARPQPTPEKTQPQKKLDFDKVAALLDKQAPRREAAAGETLNSTPALGTSKGQSARLSMSELDALRARLRELWNPPANASNPDELVVLIRVQLTREGRIARPAEIIRKGSSAQADAAAASAIRALFRGQPYEMLRKETYESWKDIEITFDPREMFGG
ncbi:MAG TPA: protein TolA [Xanthobacteraceae bacterium]|nr:protein TolA [Xanthobacteraceae bacterium]